MGMRINHNTSSINAHRNLGINSKNMSDSLEKLSSGMKINRAADGPASLVISEQMRAQIAGLNQAIDNSESAVSLIQTTEANLNEVNSLLTSMRQLSIHAANDGVNDEVMLQADQKEIENGLETINRIANQAQFGKKKLLDGSRGAAAVTTGKNLEFVGATLNTGDSRENGFDVFITETATKSTVTGSTGLTEEIVKAGEQLTVIENGKMATYTATEDDTANTMIQNLRNEIDRNGLAIDVQLDEGSGQITASHKKYGSDHKFQVSSSTAGVLSTEGGQIMTTAAGTDIRGTINGESAVGNGQVLTGVKGAKCVDGLSIRYYGDGKDELDNACKVADIEDPDAVEDVAAEEFPADGKSVGRVFVAQNSMKFQVGANMNQTVGIAVKGVHPESLSRGISNRSGFDSLADIDVTSFQGAQDAIMLIDSAINQVTADRGDLGAFQKNTLESNLANLKIQSENLISSESVIRDVDMAKEMANFTKNQILNQSSTAMLAHANQTPQSVLNLLG